MTKYDSRFRLIATDTMILMERSNGYIKIPKDVWDKWTVPKRRKVVIKWRKR